MHTGPLDTRGGKGGVRHTDHDNSKGLQTRVCRRKVLTQLPVSRREVRREI